MKKSYRRKADLPDAPSPDAARAMLHGDASEQRGAIQASIPSIRDLMQMQSFGELQKAEQAAPRPGVAMVNLDLDSDGQPRAPLYRPIGLDWPQLGEITDRFVGLQLIQSTRIRQVQRFLERPDFSWQPGLRLRFKDRARSIGPDDRARFEFLTDYLLHCGADRDPRMRRARRRDGLHEFTAKHIRDSLRYDAAPVELIPTPSGRIHGFKAIDATRVFLTDPDAGLAEEYSGPAMLNRLSGQMDPGDPSNIYAVYCKDGDILAQYTYMNLLYPIRNPSSDERRFGYGDAEPERLIQIASAFLDAFTLNARSITHNSIPRGALALIGDYKEDDVDRLRAYWRSNVRGMKSRTELPVIATPAGEGAGLQYTPFGEPPSEQLYGRWITLLMALACGLYGMDPAEISFESYSGGTASPLSGSDTEAKLTAGQDKGLYTLLSWYGRSLNEIVSIVDDEVEMGWTGLDTTKEDEQARESELMLFGESRKRHGLATEGIDPDLLNAPMNPALQGIYQMKLQAAQQPAPGDDGQAAPGQDQQDPNAQDADGDPATPAGSSDPTDETGPDGERRFQDHEGSVYQVQNAPGKPGQPLAKAYQATLFETWP